MITLLQPRQLTLYSEMGKPIIDTPPPLSKNDGEGRGGGRGMEDLRVIGHSSASIFLSMVYCLDKYLTPHFSRNLSDGQTTSPSQSPSL